MYNEEGHTKKASTTAKTALGLSIGALGVELLGGGLSRWINGGAAPAYGCNYSGEVAMTNSIYESELREIARLGATREILNQELFGVYKSQIDADFGLYKNQRDIKDEVMEKINEVNQKVEVMAATRPLQDALIMSKIDTNAMIAKFDDERYNWRTIKGVVTLPTTPTVTGQLSYPWGYYYPAQATTPAAAG